jgi:DNA-binding transcriptional ArsR family regulator
VAKVPAIADAFTAIAEPRRREVLGALAGGERDVTRLVAELGWTQPQVSKHLGVLRKVRLVNVKRKGRRRVYSVNGRELRPVYDWVKTYERFWEHQLRRIKEHAERAERKAPSSQDKPKE